MIYLRGTLVIESRPNKVWTDIQTWKQEHFNKYLGNITLIILNVKF